MPGRATHPAADPEDGLCFAERWMSLLARPHMQEVRHFPGHVRSVISVQAANCADTKQTGRPADLRGLLRCSNRGEGRRTMGGRICEAGPTEPRMVALPAGGQRMDSRRIGNGLNIFIFLIRILILLLDHEGHTSPSTFSLPMADFVLSSPDGGQASTAPAMGQNLPQYNGHSGDWYQILVS